MKKVFLLLGIAAFYSATAQQKDVFDINKHISDLLNKKKGQQNKVNPPEFKTFSFNNGNGPFSKLSHVAANGDNVYILPQDNMPCVVPGNKLSNMPNISDPGPYYDSPVFKNDTPGSIPNVVKPYKLVTSK